MKINRQTFLDDLNMVKAGLSAREFIEQSSCFVFQDGMVMTFNDEVACRKEIGLSFNGAVQAQCLLDILEKLDDPDLMVRENDKGELEFQGKRKGFGVTKDAEIFLPIDRVEMPEKWHALPEEFLEAIRLVQHCVSTDESRFLLTCIHIHPEYVEACDNQQILRCQVSCGLKSSILVRGQSLAQMADMAMKKVAMTKSWIHFKNEAGLVFSCRRYNEDYPSLDEALQVKGHNVRIPKSLVEASDRAAVFAADRSGDPLITVRLSNGSIQITGEGLSGWYKENKGVKYDGPPLVFLIRPDLLKHISDNYDDATISEGKLKVVGGHWEYVTVLGKPGEEEPEKEKKAKGKHEEED